jgi:hypothetical protein
VSHLQLSGRRDSRTATRLLWIFFGLVAGVVVGAVATACLVGYAVWNTATTSAMTSIPFVVSVFKVDGAIRATSDGGIFLPATACGLVAAAVVACVSAIAPKRTAGRP